MLAEWETFYLVVGTCAGALVGIMFIVATLGAEIVIAEVNRGTIIYQSPTVFHFGVIVAVSSLALAPEHLLAYVAGLITAIGVVGVIYGALTLWRTFEVYEFYTATHWDRLYFGALPILTYLMLLTGGLSVFWAPELAAEVIATAMLLLLLVSIRNAWDVATFSVRIARGEKPSETD